MQRICYFCYLLLPLETLGCHSKSEIDKCVDAKVESWCSQLYGTDSKKDSFRSCFDSHLVIDGGDYREQCLRAQASSTVR
jgi:hypothetical protein